MKKLLKPLFTALFAGMVCTGAKAAEPQVINIRTNDLSMVMSVAPNGEVLFHHFGGRIDDASPAAGIKSYRRTDHGTDNLAYSTMGGRNFREPALRVTHADGDMNTELRYVSHATRTLADKNVSETVVKLTDTNQALDVELVYTAYAKENVITTHTVIRNREKGDAVLHAFYSSSLPVKARSYLLTHLYGSWARESQTDHTLLTHGSKSIESRSTKWNGAPIDPKTVTTWFPGFLAAHDLPLVHFHSLRHTNASLLIAAHVPVTAVSGRLGHAKTSTTTDIYAGFIRSADAAAADALTDVFTRIREENHA